MNNSRNFYSITVAGGTPMENQQMTSLVHSLLAQNGFSNISSTRRMSGDGTTAGRSLADDLRAVNPELFDSPVIITGESEDELNAQENAAFMSMMPPGTAYNAYSSMYDMRS